MTDRPPSAPDDAIERLPAPDHAAPTPERLATVVVRRARSFGFHRLAVLPAAPPEHYHEYRAWLSAGHAGEMAFMAAPRHIMGRAHPRQLLPSVRTVIVAALAYPASAPHDPVRESNTSAGGVRVSDHGDDPAPEHGEDPAPIRGFVARYARGFDYHGVLARRLREIGRAVSRIVELAGGEPVAGRVCVDTAPILERDLSAAGGIGFIGKNTMLIAPGLGSYIVLGELLLDVDIAPASYVAEPKARGERGVAPAPKTRVDRPAAGTPGAAVMTEAGRQRCGECRACLDACPTDAFVAPWVLDARRCISYLTIEHRGAIPRDLRAGVGVRVFGCDACQDVCPYNAVAPARHRPDRELRADPVPLPTGGGTAPSGTPAHRIGRGAPDLVALVTTSESQRKRWLADTALRRASRDMWLRNACVALGNAGDPRAIDALTVCLDDHSPLVRGHAAWALGQLGAAEPLRHRADIEWDPAVREELAEALAAARSASDG